MKSGSLDGGLDELIKYGRAYNSDPGGFTLILMTWIGCIGSSPIALRSLPFLSFMGTLVILYFGARGFGTGPLWAILVASIPLTSSMLLHYATELRAYSMEALAVGWLFFTPLWLNQYKKGLAVFAFGIIAAILASSRYSAFLPAGAACFTALFPFKPWRQAFTRALLFSAPILFMVFAAYLLFVRYQAVEGLKPPDYVNEFLLEGKDWSSVMKAFKQNLFSAPGFSILAFVALSTVLYFFNSEKTSTWKNIIVHQGLFTAITLLITIFVSWWGKLPWAVDTRWSIGYHALGVFCLGTMIATIGINFDKTKNTKLIKWKIPVFIFLSILVFKSQQEAFSKGRPLYETVAFCLQDCKENGWGRLFVSNHAIPSARYLIEVGPFVGRFDYPDSVYFESAIEQQGQEPICATTYDSVILHDTSLMDSYLQRIKGKVVEIRKYNPTILIRIQPAENP